MIDPLFSRAQLAIEESRQLRHQSQDVKTQRDDVLSALRLTIFESKMHRSEVMALSLWQGGLQGRGVSRFADGSAIALH
jgi:hypothetical protein